MTGRLLPYGPRAWLVEHDDPAGLAVAVRAAARADVADVVPGAVTTLVTVEPGGDTTAVGAWLTDLLAELPRDGRRDDVGPLVEIPVVYDGEDLELVADACQLTVGEVIQRHQGVTYRCSFCGFAPGFGYLAGLDPRLQLPRRASPRPRIPAGSVAIASGYTAVYPSASPGGWHLIGRSDVTLWSTDRDPPALITPGANVRFVARGR